MDETTRAYIAGFLDGDGSIVLQLKPRRDYRYGFQIKATLSFYQKRDGRLVLEWLRERLGAGAIRERPDEISEYDIESQELVLSLLQELRPYLVAKRVQAEEAIRILERMQDITEPSPEEFLRWAQCVESYQALNYSKKRRHGAEEVRRSLSSKGFLSSP